MRNSRWETALVLGFGFFLGVLVLSMVSGWRGGAELSVWLAWGAGAIVAVPVFLVTRRGLVDFDSSGQGLRVAMSAASIGQAGPAVVSPFSDYLSMTGSGDAVATQAVYEPVAEEIESETSVAESDNQVEGMLFKVYHEAKAFSDIRRCLECGYWLEPAPSLHGPIGTYVVRCATDSTHRGYMTE
jgi:hypothetical protein